MSLLPISARLTVCAVILMLSACASVDEKQRTPSKQDEAWNDVPKPYIDGLKAARKGQVKQAIKLFKLTLKDAPRFSPAYTNMGLQQLRLKKRTAAQTSFEKSIAIKANNAISYHHLGIIARLNGEFDTALKQYKKALEIDPRYAIVHLNLGILLDLYLYQLEPALQHYETYQASLKKKDTTVSKWIIEIKQRIARAKKS